jgi:hypothetical protein
MTKIKIAVQHVQTIEQEKNTKQSKANVYIQHYSENVREKKTNKQTSSYYY